MPPSLKPRSQSRRRDNDATVATLLRAAGVLGAVAALIYLAITSYNQVPGKSYSTMYASLPQVGNLMGHDPVRIGGVRVGQVVSTATGPDGRARIKMQLDRGLPLPADTRVVVRANGLLGARFVQLTPGNSARMLPDGSVIRGGTDSLTFSVPDALDTFDPTTRTALATMVDELGSGLLGRGSQANEAIGAIRPALPQFQAIVARVLARQGAAARLMPSLDQGLAPLSANRQQIAELSAPAARALQPLVDERESLQEALDSAPGTLSTADAGLRSGVALLSATRALAKSAGRTLPYAPPSLRAAAALLRDSRTPLRKATRLLDDARRSVPAVLRITNSASPLLRPLRGGLDQLVPVLRKLVVHDCDIVNFATVFRSMTGFGGGGGEGPNGPAMAFRLQAHIPSVGEALRTGDPSGLIQRDGYPPPCKYLSTPYATAPVRVP